MARDTLRSLRAALAGEEITADYPTLSVRRFRLESAPHPAPPIMLAALRPGMLRLAAREADGAITTWLAPADVDTVRAEVGPDVELAARIFVCPTEDADTARALGPMLISTYLTVPVYRAFHEWLGRGDVLVVHGSAKECRDRVRAYVDAGQDTPIIALLPTGADPAEQLRALAAGWPASSDAVLR